jgi:hypothetical protein
LARFLAGIDLRTKSAERLQDVCVLCASLFQLNRGATWRSWRSWGEIFKGAPALR